MGPLGLGLVDSTDELGARICSSPRAALCPLCLIDAMHGARDKPMRMAAYLVANYDVIDLDKYHEYQKGAAPIMRGGGKLLVLDPASTVKEGDGAAQTVVIEYPSKEAALAAYESDEYQAVVGIRLGATSNGRAMIVEGMA